MKRTVFCIAVFFFFTIAIPYTSFADDIDMYQSSNVKPNVLIIFDNSGSMGDSAPYVNTAEYSGIYDRTKVYQRQCVQWWWIFCIRYDWVVYTGTFTDVNPAGGDGIDDSDQWIRSGNRRNYDVGTQVKISIAKKAIKEVIDDTWEQVRFGIMVLNAEKNKDSTPVTPYAAYHKDNTTLSSTYGGAPIADRDAAGITTLKGYIDLQTANGYTPLANRLINAAQYFKHANDPSFGNFGAPSFTDDPIDATHFCRQNYVIIMTDGLPTAEGDTRSDLDDVYGEFDYIEKWMEGNGVAANYDGNGNDPNGAAYDTGGSDYLDDVAKYLFDTDLRPTIDGVQNITTYVIGFTTSHQLLQDTANNGGGEYYVAYNADQLAEKLTSVLVDIIERSQTFTAPVVPVQRTTSGDKMYVSLFTPQAHNKFWPGYLMKLHIGHDDVQLYGSDETTRATDEEYNLLLDSLLAPTGTTQPKPYWEAHKALKGMDLDDRDIYTYVGTSSDLNDSSNIFVDTNTAITYEMLGSPSKSADADPAYPGAAGARRDLMLYIRGWDSYNEDIDTPPVYAEKREYIFGDILHSRPVIIDYTSILRVVYVGTNDGMLHAINDTDGTERWAFIPPDLLPELKNMVESTVPGHQYYVDGSVKVYIKDVNHNGYIEDAQGDKAIIVFGERGGGTSYTALDVTNPNDPQYLWRVDNANSTITGIPNPTTILSQLGQSWSEPEIGKVKAGANEGIVAIIGGGYSSDNTKGKGLMLINLLTGALGQAGTLVKQFTYEDDRVAYPVLDNMTACIPSTVLAVDTNYDDYIDRVYAGDLNGQMWRFGNQAGQEDGNVNNWTPRRLFQGNSGTKIFYPPDLVLEPGYAYIYFGTGDRNDPMDIPSPDPQINRFYAVKDKNETDAAFQTRLNPVGVLTESNLVDLTGDLLQVPGTPQATIEQIQSDLASGDGWFIIMDHDGEKVLAPPVVIFGIALFTTFTPLSTPCSYGGDGRIYAVDYLNATAVADFDTTNEGLQKSDQSKVLGPGIPTEAVVIIGEDGKAHVVVAVGGKIILIEELEGLFPSTGFTVQSWREQF